MDDIRPTGSPSSRFLTTGKGKDICTTTAGQELKRCNSKVALSDSGGSLYRVVVAVLAVPQ
jgi:hypothetical protein